MNGVRIVTPSHGQAMGKSTTTRRRRGEPAWVDLPDEELLDLRFCDLGLRIEETVVEDRVDRLYEELGSRGIRLRPHVWLSSEWFSPDGVPGIAVPFYLAHERLTRLENRMMLEVEGGADAACMRLLRHEAGHAVCVAYRLHYRLRSREVFGKFSQHYPESYQPKSDSRDYVVNLDWWYAQSHPAEDFAETFAVWLRSGSRWRQQYASWPAMRKLEYIDQLMRQIDGKAPSVRSKRQVEPLRQLKTTLREHYRSKRRRYIDEWPEFYDRDLQKLFSDEPKYAKRQSAAAFLRQVGPEIRQKAAEWTGVPQYTIDQVVRDMIDRCKELRLRLAKPRHEAKTHATLMVTVQTMNHLHRGHYRIEL